VVAWESSIRPAILVDLEVRKLGLAQNKYVSSLELWHWCARNRNRVYVPEWLLAEWGMQVEDTFSDGGSQIPRRALVPVTSMPLPEALPGGPQGEFGPRNNCSISPSSQP